MPHKLRIINLGVKYFEAAPMIQTKIGAQQDFTHLIQVRLYFILAPKRTIKKLRKALKIILLQFSTVPCRVVTKEYTNLKRPAAESCSLFKCVWRFSTIRRENGLKRSTESLKKSLKSMIVWNWLFFWRRNSKYKEVLLTWTPHEKWCFLWGFLE